MDLGALLNYVRDIEQYIKISNSGVLIAFEIEHIEAVDNLSPILAVPGIDLIFIDSMDLSASLGLPGKLTHPLVMEATERVIVGAQQEGIPVCMLANETPKTLGHLAPKGCTVIRAGTDHVLLRDTATETLNLFHQHLVPAKRS